MFFLSIDIIHVRGMATLLLCAGDVFVFECI